MSDEEIASEVERVVRRHLDVADRALDVSTRFVDDLGADSLAVVDLTLALEEAFDIDIADEDVERLLTLQDAIDYVEQQLAARRSS
jgi:acyl carrier protein